jgi:hypothetical protein
MCIGLNSRALVALGIEETPATGMKKTKKLAILAG